MAKLVCAFSLLVLFVLSRLDAAPSLNGASVRLALATVFATTLVGVVRERLEEFTG